MGALGLGWRSSGLLALASISMVTGYVLASAAAPGLQLASILLACVTGGALCLWIGRDTRFERITPLGLFALAITVRLLATQASPLLEDDHYRYLWDGFQTATTGNPYRWSPSYFFGGGQDTAGWASVLGGINNPDIPTIYGPVLQGLFVIAYGLNPAHIGAIQGILCGVDVLTLLLLAKLGTPLRWLLVYAVHPAVLKEALASAHPDGLVGLLLLLAVLAWERRQAIWLGLVLGLAAATKVSALVVVPFFLVPPGLVGTLHADGMARLAGIAPTLPPRYANITWVVKLSFMFCASLLLCYEPFLWVGGADWQALAVFGQQWRFNPLLYRVLELVTPAGATRAAAGLCLMLALAAIGWRWLRYGAYAQHAIPPVDTALLLLLLISPVVNPWYWLWALPVAVYRQNTAVVAMASIGAVSYVNGNVLTEMGWHTGYTNFSVPWALTALQLAVAATFLMRDWRHAAANRY